MSSIVLYGLGFTQPAQKQWVLVMPSTLANSCCIVCISVWIEAEQNKTCASCWGENTGEHLSIHA